MQRLHFCLLAALTVGVGTASAAGVKVIANSSVGASSISAEELRGVFLATKSSLSDGSHVEPVLLKGGAVHAAFLKDYLGKSDSALENYYRSLVFTGKGSMPRQFATDAEVVAYVEKTKGAIGYVAAGTNTANVKVLEVK
jgi:ABC-type phosphate transport system substrate-binding protein